MTSRMVTMLQICRKEFGDILDWHRYEKEPLRELELSSIRAVMDSIDRVLSGDPALSAEGGSK